MSRDPPSNSDEGGRRLAERSSEPGQSPGPTGRSRLAFEPPHGTCAYTGQTGEFRLPQSPLAAQLS